MPITIPLPGLRTPSVANLREHWARRAARTRAQRDLACYAVQGAVRYGYTLPLLVRIVRIMPRGTLDSDNLRMALKAVRDGIADGLGCRNDADSPDLRWCYVQERGPQGVRIEIETGGTLRGQP